MAQQLLSDRIETTIISNLFFNEDFTRKALPFIQPEYFSNADERILFSEIFKFVDGYKNLPTKDTILIELNNRKDLNEDQLKNLRQLVSNASNEEADLQWLLDTTEKWCSDRAIYLALMESIQLADGDEGKKNKDAIPSILSDALAVSFDNHVGHDYLEDYEERYDLYHRKEEEFNSTSIFSIRLRRVGFQIKHLILLSLALVLVNLCLCVMLQVVCYSKERTFYTSHLKWLKKRLQKELMLIF